MSEPKHWYIIVLKHYGNVNDGPAWRVWYGIHPMDRFLEVPQEVPVTWHEISTVHAKAIKEAFP